MKAIQFNVSIPRYVFGKVAGGISPPFFWSGLSCLQYKDVPEPELPGEQWVKVRTRYGGICGTDTSTITLHNSPYFEPFTSSPFTLGHENVGAIVEVGSQAGDWKTGQRVIAEPTLCCEPRGFKPQQWCEYCKKGELNRCTNVTKGDLAPGLEIGSCRDTGGSWSQYFTAHRSQLYPVPNSISDENAMLVEPFACGLHAALQHTPADNEKVLIIGAGTIGLMQLAALRALDCQAEIIITARYPFQAEAARRLRASEVLIGGDLYQQIAEKTGGDLYSPILGKRVLVGGVDRVFECTGSDNALDDGLRLTKAGGNVVVVGVPGMAKGIDWTAIFHNELTVSATYIYHKAEMWQGGQRSTYDIALELMTSGKVDIGWMINRHYKLAEYKRALREVSDKKRNPIIKAVFDFDE